ncbi:MAG: TolC family protein, partial [Cytophagales bacterium]|nr:TolC family protein [Cytophagales bacterium]
FQQLAGENSPLLRQIGSKKELAHQKAVKERAEFLPTVFATGNKEIYQQHVLNGMTPSWFVGLGVKWTLFDGGRRWNHLRAARKLEQRVEALEDKYQDDIKAGVQKYYNELNQARDQLQSIGTSIKFAKEYLRVKEKAFREGMAESTSVVDARLNLSKVEVEQMKALYDFDVALAKLLVLSGRSEWFVEYAQRQ